MNLTGAAEDAVVLPGGICFLGGKDCLPTRVGSLTIRRLKPFEHIDRTHRDTGSICDAGVEVHCNRLSMDSKLLWGLNSSAYFVADVILNHGQLHEFWINWHCPLISRGDLELADELLNYFVMMIVVNVMMGDEDASQCNWWGRMDDGSHNAASCCS